MGWGGSFLPGDGAGLLAELPYGLFLEDAQNGAYFWISIRSKNTFCAWLDADTRKHARMCVGAY